MSDLRERVRARLLVTRHRPIVEALDSGDFFLDAVVSLVESETAALQEERDAARAERDEARALAWREMYEGAAPLETWARLQRLLAALTAYDNQRGGK